MSDFDEEGAARDRRHARAMVGPSGAPGRTTVTSRLAPSPRSVARAMLAEMRGLAPGSDAVVARAAQSGGHGLPAGLRTRFEASLGTDLARVRIHTDDAAAAAASALGARAYAIDQDVYMGAGQYAPHTDDGAFLLAHEVAHTVQQRGASSGAPACKLEITSPGDPTEVAADTAARAMVAGTEAPSPLCASTGHVQRAPLPARAAAPSGLNEQMDRAAEYLRSVTDIEREVAAAATRLDEVSREYNQQLAQYNANLRTPAGDSGDGLTTAQDRISNLRSQLDALARQAESLNEGSGMRATQPRIPGSQTSALTRAEEIISMLEVESCTLTGSGTVPAQPQQMDLALRVPEVTRSVTAAQQQLDVAMGSLRQTLAKANECVELAGGHRPIPVGPPRRGGGGGGRGSGGGGRGGPPIGDEAPPTAADDSLTAGGQRTSATTAIEDVPSGVESPPGARAPARGTTGGRLVGGVSTALEALGAIGMVVQAVDFARHIDDLNPMQLWFLRPGERVRRGDLHGHVVVVPIAGTVTSRHYIQWDDGTRTAIEPPPGFDLDPWT